MSEFTTRYLADYQSPLFSIDSVNLTFELDDLHTRVTNEMEITRLSEEQALVLDGEHLTLLSVQVNDQVLSASQYQLTDRSLTLKIKDESCHIKIVTEIAPVENTALEGLFKSGDAYCTQCEAEGFRRISYYLDRPDVMSVFTTKVIADKQSFPYLLANGNKVASGDLANNKHFVQWHDPFPKPCYLFALVAGDFDLLKDKFITCSGREVALEIFVDRGNLSKAEHAMNSLKKSMQWDEQTFDLEYDLDIYMIVAVDFFNMGAMENKGLNVFNSKYVLADHESATDVDYFNIEAVIAHEYFHNWTGNRVTCRDWFQLSLKEGLTVFRDQQFSADQHSAAVTRIQNVRVLRAQQFAEDAGPMAHPIRPEKVMEMNNFYTLTVYEKGAEVIRMLHTLLGVDKFKQGLALYFQRFDGMAVTCDDFVQAMADAGQVNLEQFKLWYSQSGTPLLNVEQSFCQETKMLTLTVEQHNLPSVNQQEKHDLHVPIKIELVSSQKSAVKQHLLELTEQRQQWQFDADEHTVVAFLAGFSAPVKVNFEQQDSELYRLLKFGQDEFCCWDAGQKLFTRYIYSLLDDSNTKIPKPFFEILTDVLFSDIDLALKAEQLTLPSFDELAEGLEQVDPVQLSNAIEKCQQQIANHLADDFYKVYQELQENSVNLKFETVAQRALKNRCLAYLAKIDKYQHLVAEQYAKAGNMTDSLASLTAAARQEVEGYSELLNDFENKWFNTPLVMDKWFGLNAILNSNEVFDLLEQLLRHELFSLNNPNRARSLIGSFIMNNPKHFHCISGRGYLFLTEQIILLNKINPQVASRLITPLIQFKRFDQKRQELMKSQLDRLSQLPELSRDLKEKLDAALEK